MTSRRWTVVELARSSGLTVRALHHYDRIGLIQPTERTPAGHRRYTAVDVRRLYQVRALHQLGFALDDIATVLAAADDATELRHLLVSQLADLAARQRNLAERRRRIRSLLDRVDAADPPEPGEFLAVLPPPQALARRRAARGSPGPRAGRSLAGDRHHPPGRHDD